MTPQAIPTPYDIADLPHIEAPFDWPMALATVVLAGLIMAGLVLLRRSIKRKSASIRADFQSSVAALAANREVSRSQFALLMRRVRRMQSLIPHGQPLLVDEAHVEELLFGPRFDSSAALEIVRQIHDQIRGASGQ